MKTKLLGAGIMLSTLLFAAQTFAQESAYTTFCTILADQNSHLKSACVVSDAATYDADFHMYDAKLHNRIVALLAKRDAKFSLAEAKKLQQAIIKKIQSKRTIATKKSTYVALTYIEAMFTAASFTADAPVGSSGTTATSLLAPEAKVRDGTYTDQYTENSHTVYTDLAFIQQPFIAAMYIRADMEPMILKTLTIHHKTAPGQDMSQGVQKFLLYAPDATTLIGEASVNTKEDATTMSNIGSQLTGGAFVFEGNVTVYLKAVPQRTEFIENNGPLTDAQVAFSPIEVLNRRGKTIQSKTATTDRAETFSVVTSNVRFPQLVKKVTIGGQTVQADEYLYNGNVQLAIVSIPVEGNTDQYNLLVRKLQPILQASAGLTMTNITIERIGGTSNNTFTYVDLASITSTNAATYTNGADPINLVVQPGDVAYFLIRADLSGVTQGEAVRVTFDETTLTYSTDEKLAGMFVGATITPEDFSTDTTVYGK